MWNQLYSKNSCSDRGTLVQIKNLLNRRNVPADPKQNFHACDDFITTVIKAHLLASTLKLLNMTSFDDVPRHHSLDETTWMKSFPERRAILYELCKEVITTHVNFTFIPTSPKADSKSRDKVQEYADELITLGMIFLNYKDAVREGDGKRILIIWKHLLPIFRYSDRRNYSVEILLTLY